MFTKVTRHLLDFIGLKKEDVILAAHPKTGSTWIRFFFCNLISLREWDSKEVDFNLLNKTMPEFGKGDLIKSWDYSPIPRIVKTHKEYRKILFGGRKIILVLRDPRDVMISYYYYKKANKNNSFNDTLKEFIRNPQMGLKSFFEHYDSWKSNVDIVIKYEDLKDNDIKRFSDLLEELSISLQKDTIEKAAKRSNFDNVRNIEEKGGRSKRDNNFEDGFKFTRKGKTKQWKSEFDKDDLEFYEKMKKDYHFEYY